MHLIDDVDFFAFDQYLEFLKAVRDELKVPNITDKELQALWMETADDFADMELNF